MCDMFLWGGRRVLAVVKDPRNGIVLGTAVSPPIDVISKNDGIKTPFDLQV